MPYGGFSVGAGAAHPSYAGNNEVAWNKVERWMLKMQDSGAVYMTGPQPNSSVHHNYFVWQGLSGLEPPPSCDAPLDGTYCTVAQVEAYEDLWWTEVGGWRWNISRCDYNNTARSTQGRAANSTRSGVVAAAAAATQTQHRLFCNQTGNMHGGAIYPDNGSAGWDVHDNVMEKVVHWGFVWDSKKMKDMQFRSCYTDSRLFTNNGAKHNVTFAGNYFVNVSAGDAFPAPAQAIMRNAGV